MVLAVMADPSIGAPQTQTALEVIVIVLDKVAPTKNLISKIQ